VILLRAEFVGKFSVHKISHVWLQWFISCCHQTVK